MFADIGNLVGLLIFVAIAIVSALLKKKEKAEDEPFELPPELKPRGEKPRQPPSRSWEEELRRLLEDRTPPPPVVRHAPPPAPRPSPPPPLIQPSWAEPRTEVHRPKVQPRTEPVFHRPTVEPRIEPVFHQPAEFTAPRERTPHMPTLQERVAEHMGDGTHRVGTTSVQRAKVSADIADVRQMIQSRRGVRAAIIASVILGPPRGLES